jgi:hypothetical protein
LHFLSIKLNHFPHLKNDLFQIWLKMAQWFCSRSKNVKVYRKIDDWHLKKLTWVFSSAEQKTLQCFTCSKVAWVAQWLERRAQWSDDPSIGGSNPTVGCRWRSFHWDRINWGPMS